MGALWAFAAPMLAIIIVSVGDKPQKIKDIMQKSAFPAWIEQLTKMIVAYYLDKHFLSFGCFEKFIQSEKSEEK